MIKQPIWAIVSLALLVVIAGFIVERCIFLYNAERAIGRVIAVDSHNGTCGHRRSRYACTEFDATVEFSTRMAARYTLEISAGTARGYDQPLSRASRRVSDGVWVVYNPNKPTKAYEDSVWGVWGMPIVLALFQLTSLLVSISEPKGKRR
jgi:hypothetical protein